MVPLLPEVVAIGISRSAGVRGDPPSTRATTPSSVVRLSARLRGDRIGLKIQFRGPPLSPRNNTVNPVVRALRIPLSSGPPEAWISLWGCLLGGLGASGFAIGALRQYAASRTELLLGVMATFVTCALLFLLGALSHLVHLAVEDGRATWRFRRYELAAHGVGLVMVVLGGRALADASPSVAGMVTGVVLILGAYTAIVCLGCWSTLAGSQRRSGGTSPGR